MRPSFRSVILPAIALLWAADAVAQAGIANPASVNCGRQGGVLRIETNDQGGQYGICVFVDDRQCEEWALLRGRCPVGGVRVTGFVTPAARFCAITGGRYVVSANSSRPDEQGSCALPEGKICDAVAYYRGRCGP